MKKPAAGTLPASTMFYTVEAVARRLDLSAKTIRRLIDGGDLVAHRIGRNIRVADEDLSRFLARRRG